MAYEHILTERDGPVGVVTLNRPKQLNALSGPLMEELVAALEAFERDDEIRAIILTGGPSVFAAGADLKEFAVQTAVGMLTNNRIALWDRIKAISKPLIAAVSGFALGGGCELAMLCDMIIASETARFGQPEINVGLMPGAGGTQRLTRTVGKFKAMEMVMTGKFIDAREAERRGLANRVVPPEVLLDEAKRLGFELAEKPPISLRLAKECVVKAFETTLAEGIEYERKLFYFLFAAEDTKEGINAFIEKRKPVYHGR
ncbi:MAG: enoyl-CoA hydratase/isomerase family protein [Chloroflexi bacterium]|nr:enoyl-CoA hydratase/isomerase family protein [Chloroflexota bacterium]